MHSVKWLCLHYPPQLARGLGSIDYWKEQGFAHCLDCFCNALSKRDTSGPPERLNKFYEILKRADFMQAKRSKRLSMKLAFHLAE